jgi:hypothetical protein
MTARSVSSSFTLSTKLAHRRYSPPILGIATLAGYSSNRRPVTIKRTSSGKTLSSSNSPRIGDISELPRPNAHPLPGASRLSNSFGATPTYEGESSTGRKSQTEDVTGSEPSNAMHFYPTDTSADVGNGALMQPLDRDIWQETDTMYDNLPFDPAYRESMFIQYSLDSLAADRSISTLR